MVVEGCGCGACVSGGLGCSACWLVWAHEL